MKEPVIEKLLYLSTAHITPSSFSLLEQDEFNGLTLYLKTDSSSGDIYGGFLYIDQNWYLKTVTRGLITTVVPTDAYNELPIDLQRLVSFANMEEVNWIMLDCACDETDMLPSYVDEWKGCDTDD